jgi:hypothetical protein
LPALGAGKGVFTHFSCFVEKLALFHCDPALGCANLRVKLNRRVAQIWIPPKKHSQGLSLRVNLFHTHLCHEETQANSVLGHQGRQGQRA